MKKNKSIEANMQAALSAVREMTRHWRAWKAAHRELDKMESIAAYAAAFTSCKVYIENYLKHLYPNESNLPPHIMEQIRKIVSDMDAIERMDEKRLEKALHDIEQLSQKRAA